MIWKGNGVLKFEEGEPALRSCWECNTAHQHLKKVNAVHFCFSCGKYWIFGTYIDEAKFKTDSDFDRFFKSKGMKPGDSTLSIKE